ncbi:integrase [Burkholderia ubonensis]|uniref:Integrase n=2 Tax=Burkholderia cepacia complex TaxID=87882 RepID=A0A1B4PZ78_BURCE|nr:integrase [Burkholderia cepacia]AOK25997.1 integrase [Burkholderia ubonensis]KWC49809.1 integrase [Burkholderia ubonensis]
MLNKFYRIVFRKKIYDSIAALQADLDGWLDQYNYKREHQGRWCYGKTPMRTFLDSLELAKEKPIPQLMTRSLSVRLAVSSSPG